MPAEKRRYITERPPGTEGPAAEPTLTEADHDAIAVKILAGTATEAERNAYANEAWAASGIIPDRPNAGRTISGGSAK
jgi:hypothetical protein